MQIGKNMASKTVNIRKLISIGTDIKIVEEKFIKSKIIFSNRITGIGNKTDTVIIST